MLKKNEADIYILLWKHLQDVLSEKKQATIAYIVCYYVFSGICFD